MPNTDLVDRALVQAWVWWLLWIWNAFLVLGSLSLCMGYMVGVEYTEYEWPLNLLRFIVVVTVAIQVIGTILRRRASRFYVSLWYTLAAGIWTIFNLSLGAVSPNIGAAGRSQNGYTGTVNLAEFDRVTTHGDGAVGIQISRTGRPDCGASRDRDLRRHRPVVGKRGGDDAVRRGTEYQTRRVRA